jgi:hypothetical protein
METPRKKTLNRFYANIFIPTLLFIIALAVMLPFALPQEQRITTSQVYRAIQRIRLGP